jgi:hypothetical protein
MKNTITRSPEWWSWKKILEEIPCLGVPHFQRGQVWAQGNRAALLESMLEASPCGTFVLWRPENQKNPKSIGIPLHEDLQVKEETAWIVDGQQRTKTLLAVFQQIIFAGEILGTEICDELRKYLPSHDSFKVGEDKRTWYVALPRLTSMAESFGDWAEHSHTLNGPPFREYAVRGRKNQRLPQGMVPLGVLIAQRTPFSNLTVKKQVRDAFLTRNVKSLDSLIPWWFQFLTGLPFELSDGDVNEDRWNKLEEKDIPKLLALFESDPHTLQSFQDMFTGPRFAAGYLPPKEISTAINAYVRINRAGIRVQKEEQALALLSRWDDKLLARLASFIHRRDNPELPIDSASDLEGSLSSHRSLLVHGSDKQMGFSLWMTTVTRYTALFMSANTARHWHRVSAIDKKSFEGELERFPLDRHQYDGPKDLISAAAEQASRALLLIDRIVSDELYLDHRMARMDTGSFLPMLDLLAHLKPEEFRIAESCMEVRKVIARLLHLTMLHPYLDQAEMQALTDAVHGPVEQEKDGQWRWWSLLDGAGQPGPRSEVGASLASYTHTLHDIWKKELKIEGPLAKSGRMSRMLEWASNQFREDLKYANSLQSRTVGWLYAIERRNKARELRWHSQAVEDSASGISPSSPAACWDAEPLAAYPGKPYMYPEKQHIIPFSKGKKLAEKGGGRATKSGANAIGNLTWISQRQNGFEHGLSDRWSVFDEDHDRDNLEARGMLAEVDPAQGIEAKRALDLYREIITLSTSPENLEGGPAFERLKKLFEVFRVTRVAWMQQQMEEWLRDESPQVSSDWLLDYAIIVEES